MLSTNNPLSSLIPLPPHKGQHGSEFPLKAGSSDTACGGVGVHGEPLRMLLVKNDVSLQAEHHSEPQCRGTETAQMHDVAQLKAVSYEFLWIPTNILSLYTPP